MLMLKSYWTILHLIELLWNGECSIVKRALTSSLLNFLSLSNSQNLSSLSLFCFFAFWSLFHTRAHKCTHTLSLAQTYTHIYARYFLRLKMYFPFSSSHTDVIYSHWVLAIRVICRHLFLLALSLLLRFLYSWTARVLNGIELNPQELMVLLILMLTIMSVTSSKGPYTSSI